MRWPTRLPFSANLTASKLFVHKAITICDSTNLIVFCNIAINPFHLRLFHIDGNTAKSINNINKAKKINLRIIVNAQLIIFFNCLNQQCRSAS